MIGVTLLLYFVITRYQQRQSHRAVYGRAACARLVQCAETLYPDSERVKRLEAERKAAHERLQQKWQAEAAQVYEEEEKQRKAAVHKKEVRSRCPPVARNYAGHFAVRRASRKSLIHMRRASPTCSAT